MLNQTLSHTPSWVFLLLAVILAVGVRQTLPSRPTLRRVSVLPIAMSALSLMSLNNLFAAQPIALLGWLLGAGAFVAAMMSRRLPQGTHYDASTQSFTVPGSLAPLTLMLAVFAARYAAAITFALRPELARDPAAAMVVGALYGSLCGVFIGRAARLWRLAAQEPRATRDLSASRHAA